MPNILLGFNNLTDSATITGTGGFNVDDAVAIKNRLLSVKAYSSAGATASGFDFDLGSAKSIRVFGAINCTLPAASTYRLRGSSVNTFASTVYDSGVTTVGNQTPNLILGLASAISARYWRIEFAHTGIIDVGRVFIGDAFAPANNYSKGSEIGYEARTEVAESMGGVEFFNVKSPRRAFNFQLDWLTDAEVYNTALELQRLSGIDKEVLLIADSSDTTYNQKRNFLGRLRQLTPLQNPYLTNFQAGFNVVEIVA